MSSPQLFVDRRYLCGRLRKTVRRIFNHRVRGALIFYLPKPTHRILFSRDLSTQVLPWMNPSCNGFAPTPWGHHRSTETKRLCSHPQPCSVLNFHHQNAAQWNLAYIVQVRFRAVTRICTFFLVNPEPFFSLEMLFE